MGEPDLNNDETPITSYDKNFYEKNDNPNAPIHTITMKKPKVVVSRSTEKNKKKKDMEIYPMNYIKYYIQLITKNI